MCIRIIGISRYREIIGKSTRLSGYRETGDPETALYDPETVLGDTRTKFMTTPKHVNINSEKLQNPKKNDFGTYVMI